MIRCLKTACFRPIVHGWKNEDEEVKKEEVASSSSSSSKVDAASLEAATSAASAASRACIDHHSNAATSAAAAVTWDVDLLVEAISQQKPEFCWSEVVTELDHHSFIIKSRFIIIMDMAICKLSDKRDDDR